MLFLFRFLSSNSAPGWLLPFTLFVNNNFLFVVNKISLSGTNSSRESPAILFVVAIKNRNCDPLCFPFYLLGNIFSQSCSFFPNGVIPRINRKGEPSFWTNKTKGCSKIILCWCEQRIWRFVKFGDHTIWHVWVVIVQFDTRQSVRRLCCSSIVATRAERGVYYRLYALYSNFRISFAQEKDSAHMTS